MRGATRSIRWFARAFPVGLGLIVVGALGFAFLVRIQRVVEAPGEVRVERYQVVRPQVSGLVMTIHAEPGERVYRGQVLLELRDHELERELSTTRRALEEIRTRLRKLGQELRIEREAIHPLELEIQRSAMARGAQEAELAASRVIEAELQFEAAKERSRQMTTLSDAGLVSQQELQESLRQEQAAEQRFFQAQIQERTARMEEPSLANQLQLLRGEQRRTVANLEAEREELEVQRVESMAQMDRLERLRALYTLDAGMDGVLVGFSPHELLGRHIAAGQELLTIIDDTSIQFRTRVPEHALVQVRSGQLAQVEIVGLPKDRFQLFSGRVEKIPRQPDMETATTDPSYPVEIRLDAPWIVLEEGRFYLRGGMRGRAEIAYRHDISMLRVFYEFLIAKPQLPESVGEEASDVATGDGFSAAGARSRSL